MRTELFWAIDRVDRYRLCAELVQAAGRVVIVCRTQADATRVAGELSRHGVPAASVEHRDFSAPYVRAQVVTDETALSCERNGATCVIQFDPARGTRRYRRRLDLLAAARALVVTLVVPERSAETRLLLSQLDLPDVISGVDLAVARRALLEAAEAAVDQGEASGRRRGGGSSPRGDGGPGDGSRGDGSHGDGARGDGAHGAAAGRGDRAGRGAGGRSMGTAVGAAGQAGASLVHRAATKVAEQARGTLGAAGRLVRPRRSAITMFPASASGDQAALHGDQRAS